MTLAMTKPVERPEQRPRAKRDNLKRPRPTKRDPLKLTAYTAVMLTLGFSAWLNGEANAFYAGEGHLISAWAMGLSVPALVFLMGRLAQLCKERKATAVSNAAGIVGIVLLFLSVHHCSTSIQSITGAPWYLALASAISIDCGLVVSELAAMVRPPKQPRAATTNLRIKK
jgi:hypothetical protein